MTGRFATLGAFLLAAVSCGSPMPTGPSTPAPGTKLAVICYATTLLAGDRVVCEARAGSQNVSFGAVWTSSDPNVAASMGIGLFVGRSDGQATLRASYSGESASAVVTVRLQDVLRVQATGEQGSFRVGTSVMLRLQGFYGVASEDTGVLTLVATDQAGTPISTSVPLVVAHGADQYLISTTFTLPPGVTRVCRKGVLQISQTALTAIPDASLVPCFDVSP